MDKYIIAPPSGSSNNSVGASDRKWEKGYFENLVADDVVAKGPVVDVRAFGAKGDGVTDDTAAIEAAIDYMPVTTQTIYTRRTATIPASTLLIPEGVYVVDNLQIKKPINLICQGKLIGNVIFGDDNATDFVYYSTISGLSCDTFVVYPACMCRFENIRATYSVTLIGKNNFGLMYNKFSCISTSRFIIDVNDGFVNLNRFANIEAVGDSNNYGIEIIGNNNNDCHGNVFETIDVSYGKGIKNSSDAQQKNTIIGMYMEGGTGQSIEGNFDVIAPVFPYTGDGTKIRTTWQNNMLSVYGGRESGKISYTPQNLAMGGCWEYVRDGNMMCVYTSPANLMSISTDSTNPAGINNVLKGTFSEGNIIGVNLGVIRTGVVNVALLYKGTIKEMNIGDLNGIDQWREYDDEGISLDNGWKLIRARKTTALKERYDLTITTGAGDFEIGAIVSSNAELIGVPVAPRICHEIITHQTGDMASGTTSIDVNIPFSMSYADVLSIDYTFRNGGDSMANITKSYIKSSNASGAVIHVEYTTPCSFAINVVVIGILA